ncbi:MAG TPA: DUF4388 domain-containing protein, partial [Chroococcales cyanobacterium]
MIEGNFRDVSLPGLLQFLASEVNKNYRVKVSSGSQTGEIFVCRGAVISAVFGLLEGEDAVCEFLAWRDGVFGVELLNPQFDIKKNLVLPIKPSSNFVDQSSFLVEQSIGLNALMICSADFGTEKWQEALKIQPLEREDFNVIAWLGDGRTMRQAMREFSFDIVKATGILFRLVTTRSIKVLRPGIGEEPEEMSNYPNIKPDVSAYSASSNLQRYVTTGGQEAAAASVAQQAARAYAAEDVGSSVQDAFVSTSFKVVPPEDLAAKPLPPVPQDVQGREDLAQARASLEARMRA